MFEFCVCTNWRRVCLKKKKSASEYTLSQQYWFIYVTIVFFLQIFCGFLGVLWNKHTEGSSSVMFLFLVAIDQTLRLPMVVDRTPITGPCNRTLTRLGYVLHQMDSVPVLLVPLVPVSIANKRAITRPIAPKTKLVSIANKRAITRPIAPKKRSPTTPPTPPTTLKNTETTTVAHCKEPTW